MIPLVPALLLVIILLAVVAKAVRLPPRLPRQRPPDPDLLRKFRGS